MYCLCFRSAVSPISEPESAQGDKQKLGQDYYNMVPPKMHPRVGTEDLLTSEGDKQQEVIVQHVRHQHISTTHNIISTDKENS